MQIVEGFTAHPPFIVCKPLEHRHPFVFNSPHSGAAYPRSFVNRSKLDRYAIRRSEDAHVARLFGAVVDLGAPLLHAQFPRAYVDVNREPYELDPQMFDGPLPAFANTRSARVASGLGTIARIVADAQEIYSCKLDVAEALERIERLYKPFHAELRGLVARTRIAFGSAVLIDCHSMPSFGRSGREMKLDCVLGDLNGSSCDPRIATLAFDILSDIGFQVGMNQPYSGGFITRHYGRPAQGLHALQIEINRGLYMNERTLEPTSGFEDIQATIGVFANRFMQAIGALNTRELPQAAE